MNMTLTLSEDKRREICKTETRNEVKPSRKVLRINPKPHVVHDITNGENAALWWAGGRTAPIWSSREFHPTPAVQLVLNFFLDWRLVSEFKWER